MTIETRKITKENSKVLSLPNEPFYNEGRVIPIYDGKDWSFRIEKFEGEKITEDCFPDENYNFDDMGADVHGVAAYIDGSCVGFAITREQWNKWLYVDNILVIKDARRKGVASALIAACMDLAAEYNKIGLWLVCQDNNLSAMQCYLKNGFTFGGMNIPVYEGTGQAGKIDLYLYKRL